MADDEGFIWDKNGFKNANSHSDKKVGRGKANEEFIKQTEISGQVSVTKEESELTGYRPTAKKDKKKGARISTAVVTNTIPKLEKKQMDIFEILEQEQSFRQQIQETSVVSNMEKLGANLSVKGGLALLAIPKLLRDNGVYDEVDRKRRETGKIVPKEILVSRQDFLRAYGLRTSLSSRGKLEVEGGGQAVADAMAGLKELITPIVQLWGLKKGSKYDYAEKRVEGLINSYSVCYYDIDDKEFKQIAEDDPTISTKTVFIRILPSKIFFTASFLREPEHIISELQDYLRQHKKRLTDTHLKLGQLLALEAHNGHNTIDRDLDTMLANVGQNKNLKEHRKSRAKKQYDKAVEDYQGIGVVKKAETYNHPYKGKRAKLVIDGEKVRGEEDEPKNSKKTKKK